MRLFITISDYELKMNVFYRINAEIGSDGGKSGRSCFDLLIQENRIHTGIQIYLLGLKQNIVNYNVFFFINLRRCRLC